MIVFSKMDKKTGRSINELTNLMRLEEIIEGGNHIVTQVTFNIQIVITRYKHRSLLHDNIEIDFLEIWRDKEELRSRTSDKRTFVAN